MRTVWLHNLAGTASLLLHGLLIRGPYTESDTALDEEASHALHSRPDITLTEEERASRVRERGRGEGRCRSWTVS